MLNHLQIIDVFAFSNYDEYVLKFCLVKCPSSFNFYGVSLVF